MPAPPSPPVLAAEIMACLRFYTRLALPALAIEAAHRPEPFSRCLRWAPLAGVAVGGCGAAVLLAAAAAGLPPLAGAALALLATVLTSGGLHEDGLADAADGFGGGRTRERKLEIMRDSRIGSYGALALSFSVLLRAVALGALAQRGGAGLAAAALVAGAAASRGIGLLPMAALPPARADGLGHGAGRLPASVLAFACGLSAAAGLAIPTAAGAGPLHAALALAMSCAAAAYTARFAQRQVGGVTGDVAGACQQGCEVVFLLGLLVAPGTA